MSKTFYKITLRSLGLTCLLVSLIVARNNLQESQEVGVISAQIYQELMAQKPVPLASDERDMPVITIDGVHYIGTLDIPQLKKRLPVAESFSYPQLKRSPALFDGSYKDHSMIICAHNYSSQFLGLDQLKPGDTLFFVTATHQRISYQVTNIEVLNPDQIDQLMKGGDWDLTLFTCTFDTLQRIIIRANVTP